MKGKTILASVFAVVVLLAVMATPVMAATETVISGTVPAIVEVSAPANFTMPSLNPNDSPVTSGTQTATVDANHAGWTLTVVEAGGSPDGKMSGDPGTLTNAMLVKGGDETTYTSLASAVTLESSGSAGTGQTISDISFQQAVTWGDAAGDYSITVTFTATAATP